MSIQMYFIKKTIFNAMNGVPTPLSATPPITCDVPLIKLLGERHNAHPQHGIEARLS